MENIRKEQLQILKEEMNRLHDILKQDGDGRNKDKVWAMEELTKIHNHLCFTPEHRVGSLAHSLAAINTNERGPEPA